MIIPGTAQEQHRVTDNVSFTVKIDGKDVTMDPGGLISLSIGLEVNRIPWARMTFSDGSVEKQDFQKSNKDLFSPGKSLEILLGYSQKQETVFKGIITRHGIKIQEGRPYRMEIECRDPAAKTSTVKKSRYFYDLADHEILQEIIKSYPDLKAGKLKAAGFKHKELVQYQVTDWDFMLLRADANGMCLNLGDGTLDMFSPEIKKVADLQVQFGMGSKGIQLLELESEIDARDHYADVKGTTWDYTKQELMDEEAGKTGGVGGGLLSAVAGSVNGAKVKKVFPDVLYKDNPVQLYHGGDLDSEELNAWVKAKLQRAELSHVRGRVTVAGIKINPGQTLDLNGVGDRFNGTHFITGVMHQMIKGHWRTDIQFGWQREFISEQIQPAENDASGLVAGIKGLHAGIVSKIEGDERSGNYRVQVRLPFVAVNPNNSESDGIWARLVNGYAGAGRGLVFRPEIDDEVIVGFINNDPNDAVILGAVHSDKNAAPEELPMSDKNPKKGFVSKEGMQLIFDDEKKKIRLSAGGDSSPSIEIDANGSKISIALDGSNSIELSSSGVKINGTRIDLN